MARIARDLLVLSKSIIHDCLCCLSHLKSQLLTQLDNDDTILRYVGFNVWQALERELSIDQPQGFEMTQVAQRWHPLATYLCRIEVESS